MNNLSNITYPRPRGIVKDVVVKKETFVFPIDFVILDMEEDLEVPIILGRPFLNTARAMVDVGESKLTLTVGTKALTFGL